MQLLESSSVSNSHACTCKSSQQTHYCTKPDLGGIVSLVCSIWGKQTFVPVSRKKSCNTQAAFKSVILLPQLSQCWDCRYVAPHLATTTTCTCNAQVSGGNQNMLTPSRGIPQPHNLSVGPALKGPMAHHHHLEDQASNTQTLGKQTTVEPEQTTQILISPQLAQIKERLTYDLGKGVRKHTALLSGGHIIVKLCGKRFVSIYDNCKQVERGQIPFQDSGHVANSDLYKVIHCSFVCNNKKAGKNLSDHQKGTGKVNIPRAMEILP